jgi:hypothetical protein
MFRHKRAVYVGLKKKKDEIFPVHTMKVYRGSRGTSPLILHLGTRWMCMVSATPRPHSLEIISVPMQQEAVWTFRREPYIVLGMWMKGGAVLAHYALLLTRCIKLLPASIG